MELKKGEFALRAGETCKHSFFVEHGLLKQYTIDEKGKEHILLFAPEYWFAANIETVHFGRPSDYFMEALEPTTPSSTVCRKSSPPSATSTVTCCTVRFRNFRDG